ncbi:uncharacterized protein LOC129587284 [Paramacrobiotus metropolitanus]|uniref:uncharacterized protein LOC129587284 n=1 Tax=Paramacrobiotus metropolitanus TaxID=2943436 RepID=UPI0024464312|nr:uncharacterized protein LOC129587284 [Paramacrobiotus metropolitanus]
MNWKNKHFYWIVLFGCLLCYSQAEETADEDAVVEEFFRTDSIKNEPGNAKHTTESSDYCDAKSSKCEAGKTTTVLDSVIKDATKFIKDNAHKHDSVPKMMDATGEFLVDLGAKYFKEYSEGKLSLARLANLDNLSQLVNMAMRSTLPGGNPLAANAVKFFQKLITSLMEYGQRTVQIGGLDLKPFVDESHSLLKSIVPGLVIALQHSDNNCKKPALCRVARSASQFPSETTKSLGDLLTMAVATFIDATSDKPSKKDNYVKVYECCSVQDKAIFDKCSKKYFSDDECTGHKMSNPNLLKPIPLNQLMKILKQLPVPAL